VAFQSFAGGEACGAGGVAAAVQSFVDVGRGEGAAGAATLPQSFVGVLERVTAGMIGSGFFGTSCTCLAGMGGTPAGAGIGAGCETCRRSVGYGAGLAPANRPGVTP
jgi:hypothetical protein